jgi:hypothetical protein
MALEGPDFELMTICLQASFEEKRAGKHPPGQAGILRIARELR